MNKILKRLITTALFVVMFTMAFKSTTPVQAATPTVTITYNANGGTVRATGPEGTKQTVKKDTYVKLAPPSIARNGYVLLGYAQNKNASYPGYLLCNAYKFSYNVTLYAVWAKRSEIYDRYGDSFSYGLDMSRISSTLDLFSERKWVGQSTYTKIKRVTMLTTALANLYGISNLPKVAKGLPADALEGDIGYYKAETNTIYLHPILYVDDWLVIDRGTEIEEMPACHLLARTIAHELRHAYQFERACNPRSRIDYLFAYNYGFYGYGINNYIDPITDVNGNPLNIIEYQDQIIEAEAFGVEKLLIPHLK
ncbi:MAG: InlB B-repeat-containing protein [Acetatifactor sp.]|nr:InlB B-repeat-containing protein [Acetatifactor sp.]